ncbi:MAG: helix-turn-helix domain-containing protein [Martelella sp.]
MTNSMKQAAKNWDRHEILAEIRRRGMTLSGIAEDAGLEASACRHGIARRNRKGAVAIADALGIPFETLFPGYHARGHNSDANLSLKKRRASRQNDTRNADQNAA